MSCDFILDCLWDIGMLLFLAWSLSVSLFSRGVMFLVILEVEDSVLEHVGHVIFHSQPDMFGIVESF